MLGNGTTRSSPIPVHVVGVSHAIDVAAGWHHVCAIDDLDDKTRVLCWGYKWSKVGENGPSSYASKPEVVGEYPATTIAHGRWCAFAGDPARATWRSWGEDDYGERGTFKANLPDAESPEDAPAASGARLVTIGASQACGIFAGGTVRCWGAGILGDGTTTRSISPVPVPIRDAISLVAGDSHTCAMMKNHEIRCWGYDPLGSPETRPDRPVVLLPQTIDGVEEAP